MCHFITLIVPTEDTAALAAVMKPHGREAWAIHNPSLAKILQPGAVQYLTARHGCDCGTVLGRRAEAEDELKAADDKEMTRLRRKGWSEARITRALADKAHAESRPQRLGPDSLDLWAAILGDLAKDLHLPHAGLFVRSYSGDQSTEAFAATRREIGAGEDRRDALASMTEDEVTVFRFTA